MFKLLRMENGIYINVGMIQFIVPDSEGKVFKLHLQGRERPILITSSDFKKIMTGE